jgi:alpha-galactosidase
MGVFFDESTRTFHLRGPQFSYVFRVGASGHLTHLHWGARLRSAEKLSLPDAYIRDRAFSPGPVSEAGGVRSLDTLPQEYPSTGTSDFRAPGYVAQQANGATAGELLYVSHTITSGKPPLAGLPATYVEAETEAETLTIELNDAVQQLSVFLTYTVFEDFNALTRSVCFRNSGDQALDLRRALSCSVDLPHADFEMLQLSGAWSNERGVVTRPLVPGVQSVESRRGASSHQQNPFLALLAAGSGEEFGDVYGFSLVYSGNFLAQTEVDQFGGTRVSLGINPFDFAWRLAPGEEFQTPETVMVYSGEGLGGMSRTYHRLYRTRLCRGQFRDQVRPVLINNWEATYFNFDPDKLTRIASSARELGIELFVLDDGWFGKRDDDHSGLGDWFVNERKLPGGLGSLGEKITADGMQFGLWFEPEMVSPDSDLYRAHPDWCIHVADRRRSTGRQQLILDFSRDEVCEAVIKMVGDVLQSAPITYVKWDMNRHMTEPGSAALPPERQRELPHRYLLGVYRVMENLTARFPQILFESCSGGGGRFDPGMLYYMPQTWTSDNTDAVCRLKIQYGTSLIYPASTMGAHVSAVPNHQLGRLTSLQMRGHVAMSGNFGYEMDLSTLSEAEKELVCDQVRTYRQIAPLVQQGEMYRLLSPFDGNEAAWMFVSQDRREAAVFWFKVLAQPNEPLRLLKFKGLDPELDYRRLDTGETFGGDLLMSRGMECPMQQGDFQSALWRLRSDV